MDLRRRSVSKQQPAPKLKKGKKTVEGHFGLLKLTKVYFSSVGWDVLSTSEGIMLVYIKDPDLYYDFQSLGGLWRWWREVYRMRRQFICVIEKASTASVIGHLQSASLIDWLKSEDGRYPPLMSAAYYDQWPHRLKSGWLAHAAALERQWLPGGNPLDIARAIAGVSRQ